MDGLLVEVVETTRGSQATAVAAVAATSVAIENVADYPTDGGIVDVLGVRYSYTAVTPDPEVLDPATGDVTSSGTLTIPAGLSVQVDEYDPVLLVVGGEVATVATAVVDLPAGADSTTPDGGDPVRVPLTRTQRSVFLVGPYDPPVPVTLSNDLTVVLDTPDVAPSINGSFIDPTTLPTQVPADPPAVSPSLEVVGMTSTLFVKADDVEQTTTIEYHISTVNGFTPDPTTLSIATRATLVAIDELPDTTPLAQGTTYYLVAVATNVAGDAAPSAQVSAQLNQITQTQISDGAISTPKLAAGAINADIVTGGTFQSVYTVTGSLKIGNITLTPGGPGDPGGLYIPLSSGGFIRLPADGSDADIQCNLHALSAVIDDNLVIRGAGNDIAGTITIDNIPTAPKVAPTVSSPLVVTGSGFQVAGNGLGGSTSRLAGVDGTNFYANDTAGDLYSINKSTGVATLLHHMGSGAITKVGTGWATLSVSGGIGTSSVYVNVFDASWNVTASFQVWSGPSYLLGSSISAIGTDGTNILVAGPKGTATNKVYTYTTSGVQVGSAVTLNAPTFLATDPIMPVSLSVGSFDYGASRYVVSFDDQVTRVFNSSGNEQTANRFATTSSTVQGSAWDGSAFWLMVAPTSPNQFDFRKLSGQLTAVSRVAKWTQYCDGTRVGNHGARETKASPTKSATHGVRSYFQVVTPPPADSGSADDPNAVRIYVDAHLQTTLTAGWSATYASLNTSNPDSPSTEGWVGVSGLTVALGTIQSQGVGPDGVAPAFQVKGDGTGQWEAVMPTGSVLPYAAAAAPTGFLKCDGASYLRTAYPRLFAVIGTTFGAVDGTHFNVPDLTTRFPLGAGTDPDGVSRPLGQASGSMHIATAQLPAHHHNVSANYATTTATGGSATRVTDVGNTTGGTGTLVSAQTSDTGSGNAFLPPYLSLTYIIKA